MKKKVFLLVASLFMVLAAGAQVKVKDSKTKSEPTTDKENSSTEMVYISNPTVLLINDSNNVYDKFVSVFIIYCIS